MTLKRMAAAAALIVSQIACTQAGDAPRRSPDAAGSHACDPRVSADCPPERKPDATIKPAVPPVPESPIKIDCSRLPTQVERDTCTNRKESTG